MVLGGPEEHDQAGGGKWQCVACVHHISIHIPAKEQLFQWVCATCGSVSDIYNDDGDGVGVGVGVVGGAAGIWPSSFGWIRSQFSDDSFARAIWQWPFGTV